MSVLFNITTCYFIFLIPDVRVSRVVVVSYYGAQIRLKDPLFEQASLLVGFPGVFLGKWSWVTSFIVERQCKRPCQPPSCVKGNDMGAISTKLLTGASCPKAGKPCKAMGGPGSQLNQPKQTMSWTPLRPNRITSPRREMKFP